MRVRGWLGDSADEGPSPTLSRRSASCDPSATGVDGLRATEVTEAAYRSAKAGKAVKI